MKSDKIITITPSASVIMLVVRGLFVSEMKRVALGTKYVIIPIIKIMIPSARYNSFMRSPLF